MCNVYFSFFSSLNVSELVNKWQQKAESLNLTELLEEQCAMGKEYSTKPNSTQLKNHNNSFWYVWLKTCCSLSSYWDGKNSKDFAILGYFHKLPINSIWRSQMKRTFPTRIWPEFMILDWPTRLDPDYENPNLGSNRGLLNKHMFALSPNLDPSLGQPDLIEPFFWPWWPNLTQ